MAGESENRALNGVAAACCGNHFIRQGLRGIDNIWA